MSTPRIPFRFVSGDTLNPAQLNRNFQRIASDLKASQDREWTYSSFVLDFTGLASGANEAYRKFTINAPKGFEIVGMEMEVYQASGQTLTLTCSAAGATVVTVASAGVTTKASSYVIQNGVRVALNTDVSFTLSSTGGTNTACKAVIHIRSTRWSNATRTEYPLKDIEYLVGGNSVNASTLNGAFTNIEDSVVADTNAQDDLKIQVIAFRGLGTVAVPTHKNRYYLPAAGRKFSRLKSYGACAASGTDDFVITLYNSAGVSQGAASILASSGNATTQDASSNVNVNQTQATDITDTNDDWYLEFSRVGTTDNSQLWYAVLYQV